MAPTGFEPVEGKRFTFQTKPGGDWDGVIHCRVLEVIPNGRLVYAWKGGHEDNIGYGAPLDTVVTWTLTPAKPARASASSMPASSLPSNESPPSDHERRLEEGRPAARRQSPAKRADRSAYHGERHERPYTGGCACGAIRYEISAEPIFMNHCQCRDCQRESGTGHGSYLTFPRARR